MQDRYKSMQIVHRVSEMMGQTVKRLEVMDAQGFITFVDRKIFVYRERELDDAPEPGDLLDSYYLLPPYAAKGVSLVMLQQIAIGGLAERYQILIHTEELEVDLYPFLQEICKVEGAPSISRESDGYRFTFPITLDSWNRIRETRTVIDHEVYELIFLSACLNLADDVTWTETKESDDE